MHFVGDIGGMEGIVEGTEEGTDYTEDVVGKQDVERVVGATHTEDVGGKEEGVACWMNEDFVRMVGNLKTVYIVSLQVIACLMSENLEAMNSQMDEG